MGSYGSGGVKQSTCAAPPRQPLNWPYMSRVPASLNARRTHGVTAGAPRSPLFGVEALEAFVCLLITRERDRFHLKLMLGEGAYEGT
jgi:hypothetical protein